MQCTPFGTTLSPDICIKRQAIAKQGYVTKRYENKDGHRDFNIPVPESFKKCLNCSTGKLVKLFPNRFIKRDFLLLINAQLKVLNERGYVFKTEIDLVCMMVADKNEKLTEDERIELIDHIAQISQKLVIERRLNGKPHRILSATGCRIARYLRKQRNKERNKQIDSSSVGT